MRGRKKGKLMVNALTSQNRRSLGAKPTEAMKLLCWSVREMGNPRTVAALKRIIKRFSPDLVFLCETKIKGETTRLAKDQLGFVGGVHVDCKGKSGGLMMVWNKDVDITLLSFSSGERRGTDVAFF
ncbi:hypothetical protein Ddye_001164 [Dipteronia dyeriana]|uniref:Uncharacterized protein n=1 Tax=Dipteronia dyeriana TaxID=168575 RepID=A0AAE0CT21_9ROSI|nr:hypothetical protein Ddye_001164 [Dipteronia dyeriana]